MSNTPNVQFLPNSNPKTIPIHDLTKLLELSYKAIYVRPRKNLTILFFDPTMCEILIFDLNYE